MVTVRYGKREEGDPAPVGAGRPVPAVPRRRARDLPRGQRAAASVRVPARLHHDDQSELLAPRHANVLGVYPLFAGDRVTELVQFLDDHLGDGRGLGVLRSVREGKYRPHKKLLDHTAAMIKGEPSYVLLDEQQVVFKTILAKVAEARDLGTKAVFVIRGGPGTGKSVIALNLVAELAPTATPSTTPPARRPSPTPSASGSARVPAGCSSSSTPTSTPRTTPSTCSSATRRTGSASSPGTGSARRTRSTPTVPRSTSCCRSPASVFFIDDMQAVKRDEIGNSDDIERLAEMHGAEVHEFELEAQFRCGGSDGFVRWIESTLGIRRTANASCGPVTTTSTSTSSTPPRNSTR
jgi:uncharacterized protein